MSTTRTATASLLGGLVHAAVLVGVGLDLGYEIGPGAYTAVGALWRYGGLVVVAAVPLGLALRYRLVGPLLAVLLASGYVLGVELAPPGPTFVDVAELERLAEPTGMVVVEDGLYVVRYTRDASVWTVGFLLVGLVEHAARTTWDRLPSTLGLETHLPIPASPRRAAIAAEVAGLLHAGVMAWFAYRLGLTVAGGYEWLLYPIGVLGMWLLAAVPVYLLLRRRLLAPTALLAAFVLLDARAELSAGVDSPHALYFGAWFLFLGVLLVAAGLEYGLRRLA